MEDPSIKEKILKGSEELFMKYGVRSISMDDVARHLSVSKKTLYQHFTDKDEIVQKVSQAHCDRNQIESELITANSENAIDELARLSIMLKKQMEELNPSLLFDLQKYHPAAWAVWLEFKSKCVRESVVRNLRQGIAEGHFRDELNSEILATARIILMEVAFDEQFFPRDKFEIVEVQSQLFDHFVFGICTEKGRKLYTKYRAEIANHETIPK
ncbi:MAG: TetR/AcrR family transcriptional regulator [Bacteroidota bacterium]